jgi:hypothetical protein
MRQMVDSSCYLRAESPFDVLAREDIAHEGAVGINSDWHRFVGSNRGHATLDSYDWSKAQFQCLPCDSVRTRPPVARRSRGAGDSNQRTVQSKSARTLSNVNAHSEYGAKSAAICINRLARISEWATTNPARVRRRISDALPST